MHLLFSSVWTIIVLFLVWISLSICMYIWIYIKRREIVLFYVHINCCYYVSLTTFYYYILVHDYCFLVKPYKAFYENIKFYSASLYDLHDVKIYWYMLKSARDFTLNNPVVFHSAAFVCAAVYPMFIPRMPLFWGLDY